MELSKGTSLIYKYIKDDKIAYFDKLEKISNEEYEQIKKDTKVHEKKRDHVYGGGSFKEGNRKIKNDISANGAIDNYNSIDVTLSSRDTFEDYTDEMNILTRSILAYNSMSFARLLDRYEFEYEEIKMFITVINTLKSDLGNNLHLLLSSDYIFEKFYEFSKICKVQYGYGTFADVTNKLEQMTIFEDKTLQKWTKKKESNNKK